MALGSDERGVSAVVGATLIFGFLVIFLALYQATVVPSQNEQVEFDHSQSIQRDMVDVRNTFLETKETGRDGYTSVTLGTTYPARTIAINPPPVTGTLRTTENHSYEIRDAGGATITETVCPGDGKTRFLVYEPSYHVYTEGPDLVYENSLVYEQYPTGNVTLSGQTLVQGDTINVIPLQQPYSRSGMATVGFESKAGLLDTTEVEDPTLVLPTRLGQDDWEEILDGQLDGGTVSVGDGNVTIDLDGEYVINCGPVGVGESPPSGARGGGTTDINPAGPGAVVLSGGTFSGGNSDLVHVVFNNTASNPTNITRAKLNFFFNQGGPDGFSPVVVRNASTGTTVTTLDIGGDRLVLDPEVHLPAGTEVTLEFEFSQSVQEGDFFILELTFQNGRTGTYFVAPFSA